MFASASMYFYIATNSLSVLLLLASITMYCDIAVGASRILGVELIGNLGGVDAADRAHHGRPASLSLTLPPLGAVILMP